MPKVRLGLVLGLLAAGCKPASAPPEDAASVRPPAFDATRIPRAELNRLMAASALPLLWRDDANGNGALDPSELVITWGLPAPPTPLVAAGAFTPAFETLYEGLIARAERPLPKDLPEPERVRRKLVLEELAQSRPAVVETRLGALSEPERAMLDQLTVAAELIERIYAHQTGAFGLERRLRDPESRMLFFRNQGPWCVAPRTESNPACSAIPGGAPRVLGLYPAGLQAEPGFCDRLAAHPRAKTLLDPFTVVREEAGELAAMSYQEAYLEEMEQVARTLEKAARALGETDEAPFRAYLRAAARAFLDGSWSNADEAWARMNGRNSKWYLRVGPDEVYFEPCNRKAGFHLSLAKINPDSIAWQARLDPLKQEMEKALARLAGPPYRPRQVSFQLPDFIDVVLNAADARSPQGATVGQSLPNWGPVAEEGRGRTVAMTNLYTDADSRRILRDQAASVLCPDTMSDFVDDPGPQILSTVLHEAAHNLGPAHGYAVQGRTASEIFGGPLASTLEELKAQTAALWLTDWLVSKEVVEPIEARRAHLRDVVWSFGHVARGMYDADRRPKPYSQLSAIQLGALVDGGAATWRPKTQAANRRDLGCLAVDLDRFGEIAQRLMGQVARLLGRGDRAAADKMIAEHVDVEGAKSALHKTIRDRWLRAPKATFVYALTP